MKYQVVLKSKSSLNTPYNGFSYTRIADNGIFYSAEEFYTVYLWGATTRQLQYIQPPVHNFGEKCGQITAIRLDGYPRIWWWGTPTGQAN